MNMKRQVMSDKKNNRCKWLHIRLNEDEHKKINKHFSSSTCRKLSEYARRVLLDKVITIYQRNRSLDDFMAEMIKLRNELNAIGNNINQSVKKLHTLQQLDEFKPWIFQSENHYKSLLEKTEEIKNKINKISDEWLR